MEFRVNYTVVGLFVVLLGATFITIALWMTSNSRKEYDTYLIYMNEAVSGLNVESPVKFNGVDVGKVAKISLNPKNPQQVRVVLKIIKGTPVTQSTVAKLMSQGITGLTYIGLKAETADPTLLTSTPGSPHPIIKTSSSLLVEVDSAIRDAVNNLRIITRTFQQVFNDENRAALNRSFKNMAELTHSLAQNSQELTVTLKESRKFFHSATATSDHFNQVLNQGNASMQAISQQAVPNTLQAIQQLNQILSNLQQLSTELPNNPSMLLRGKAAPPLGIGEF